MKATNSFFNLPTFLPKTVLAAEFFNIRPFLQKSVYLINLAANFAPSYLPVGEKPTKGPLFESTSKIQSFVDQVIEKMGYPKGSIEVRITDTFAQKVSYLGSKHTYGSKLILINRELIKALGDEDLLNSPIYQEWIDELEKVPSHPYELGEYLGNLDLKQRERFLALFEKFKDIHSEREVKSLVLKEIENFETNEMFTSLNTPTLFLSAYQAIRWGMGLLNGYLEIFHFAEYGQSSSSFFSGMLKLNLLYAGLVVMARDYVGTNNPDLSANALCQYDEEAAKGDVNCKKKNLINFLSKVGKSNTKFYSSLLSNTKDVPIDKIKDNTKYPFKTVPSLAKAQFVYEKAVSKELDQKMMPHASMYSNAFALYSQSRPWIDYSPVTEMLYDLVKHSIIAMAQA